MQGHDTTTSAITFCLYEIAKHPDVQQRCFDEIREVFADKNEPATLSHLNKLSYIELVLKETLRLFPSVPIIGRRVNEDVQLSKCFVSKSRLSCLCQSSTIFVWFLANAVLPAGCNIVIPIYFMGHNSQLFPDAETFNPERSFKADSHFAYVPFSAGPRNCIGQVTIRAVYW